MFGRITTYFRKSTREETTIPLLSREGLQSLNQDTNRASEAIKLSGDELSCILIGNRVWVDANTWLTIQQAKELSWALVQLINAAENKWGEKV